MLLAIFTGPIGHWYSAWRRHHAKPDHKFGPYRDIFIGHTTTETYKTLEPVHVCNVWDIDTGAGWSGKLTIIDVESKEYWQSDLGDKLNLVEIR